MTYPMPDPIPHPTGPHGPREMAVGSALYLGEPHRRKPCRECDDKVCAGDDDLRFDHDRQYRGSEKYWMEVARR